MSVSHEDPKTVPGPPEPAAARLRPLEVLLVEDNPADVNITTTALRDARVIHEVHTVSDGEEALAYLHRQGPYALARRPDIVLLDLNLPKLDGHEVLSRMKADESLKSIPVIVISGGAREEDMRRAYHEQAASYLVKPVDIDDYFAAVRALKEVWFHFVRFPAEPDGGPEPE